MGLKMQGDFKMPVGFKMLVGVKIPVDFKIGYSFFQILSSEFGSCLTMELVKQKPFFFLQSRRNFQLKPNFVFTVAPHFFML